MVLMNCPQLSARKKLDYIRCRGFRNMLKLRDHTFGFRLPHIDFFVLKPATKGPSGCGQSGRRSLKNAS
jgi:hypothetical protein